MSSAGTGTIVLGVGDDWQLTSKRLMIPEPCQLYREVEMGEPQVVSFASGTVAVFSASKPTTDGPNEDAAALFHLGPERGVLVVADGAGGMRSGNRASSIALDAMKETASQANGSEASLRAAVLNGFELANEKILDSGAGSATTLAVATIENNLVRCYHAGDSMVLVTGQRGRVKLLTTSHSPVGYGVEAGLIDEDKALGHDQLHLVSNLVGCNDMHIELGPTRPLNTFDTVLIASDGVCDNLHLDEIIDIVRKGKLKEVAQTLVERCRKRMAGENGDEPNKPDDFTFILYRPRSDS